jgi:SET domain-containing protein
LDWGVRTIKVVPGVSPGRGRGLFAVAPIGQGEIIDRACTVEICETQTKPLDEMQPLGDFYFEHPCSKEAGLMVLGVASLCNHSDQPNAHIRFADDRNGGWIAVLYALADIAAGSEVTYRYRCPLWFEAAH